MLYVSGEESAAQVALRARRLGVDAANVRLLSEISLERIVATLRDEKPSVVVIDSIQTLYTEQLQSAPGSVAQVRECAAQLTRLAKQSGLTLIMIGHVTKEGALAGPRVLEHMVDTVLYFEGDTHSSFRLVRAFKNRFGAVNELGVFAMTDRGLKGVANPSALFLSTATTVQVRRLVRDGDAGRNAAAAGRDPGAGRHRACAEPAPAVGRARSSSGWRCCWRCCTGMPAIAAFDQDVFVNAVGGVRIAEPAADLAVLLAIVSSMRNKPLPRGLVAFGEVGLAGEIRPAPRGQERLREAAKLGFSLAMIPQANAPRQRIEGLEVITVDRVEHAWQALEQLRRGPRRELGLLRPSGARAAVPLRTAVSSVQGYSDAVQSPASAKPRQRFAVAALQVGYASQRGTPLDNRAGGKRRRQAVDLGHLRADRLAQRVKRRLFFAPPPLMTTASTPRLAASSAPRLKAHCPYGVARIVVPTR